MVETANKYVIKPEERNLKLTERNIELYKQYVNPDPANNSNARKTHVSAGIHISQRDRAEGKRYIDNLKGLTQLCAPSQGKLLFELIKINSGYILNMEQFIEDFRKLKERSIEMGKNPYVPEGLKLQNAHDLYALSKSFSDAIELCYNKNMAEILAIKEFNDQSPDKKPYPEIGEVIDKHQNVIADYYKRQEERKIERQK